MFRVIGFDVPITVEALWYLIEAVRNISSEKKEGAKKIISCCTWTVAWSSKKALFTTARQLNNSGSDNLHDKGSFTVLFSNENWILRWASIFFHPPPPFLRNHDDELIPLPLFSILYYHKGHLNNVLYTHVTALIRQGLLIHVKYDRSVIKFLLPFYGLPSIKLCVFNIEIRYFFCKWQTQFSCPFCI